MHPVPPRDGLPPAAREAAHEPAPRALAKTFEQQQVLPVVDVVPNGRVAVVELIASTKTKTGLTIRCELDLNTYPKGIKVRDEEIASLNLKGDKFHPDWNYSIAPRGQVVER